MKLASAPIVRCIVAGSHPAHAQVGRLAGVPVGQTRRIYFVLVDYASLTSTIDKEVFRQWAADDGTQANETETCHGRQQNLQRVGQSQ